MLSEKNQDNSFVEEDFENRIYSSEEIDYNIALCNLMLNNLEEAQAVLSLYPAFNKLTERNDNDDEEEIDLTPFPVTNRLCSIFSEI